METIGPLKFLGDPYVRALLFRPRRDLRARPVAARRCSLPLFVQRRLPRFGSFEAQSHGPHTRCLRFAGWITPPPRKTRFRLPASSAEQSASLCRVPKKGFNVSSYPPFPSFLDANETNPVFRRGAIKNGVRPKKPTQTNPFPAPQPMPSRRSAVSPTASSLCPYLPSSQCSPLPVSQSIPFCRLGRSSLICR